MVSASLAGLQRGELLCLQALDDASSLHEVRDAERILEQAWAGALANAARPGHAGPAFAKRGPADE